MKLDFKLNFGPCGLWSRPGWTNLDLNHGYDLRIRNLREFVNESVEMIYTSHCLEHMEFAEVARLLEASFRVLKPGATIRIVVPDVDILCEMLFTKDIEYLVEHCPGYYNKFRHIPFATHMEQLIGWDHFRGVKDSMHSSFFSWSSMASILKLVGFSDIERRRHCDSRIEEMREEATLNKDGWTIDGFDNPMAEYMSLYVEATK